MHDFDTTVAFAITLYGTFILSFWLGMTTAFLVSLGVGIAVGVGLRLLGGRGVGGVFEFLGFAIAAPFLLVISLAAFLAMLFAGMAVFAGIGHFRFEIAGGLSVLGFLIGVFSADGGAGDRLSRGVAYGFFTPVLFLVAVYVVEFVIVVLGDADPDCYGTHYERYC